ncbi:MAG: hypothetical protein CM15mP117_13090 [Alphaproteobacteria bacterium]|nr:MAG: hypothetical protein CM15mP117_13090 [Alphaproteobacteria bacterium]
MPSCGFEREFRAKFVSLVPILSVRNFIKSFTNSLENSGWPCIDNICSPTVKAENGQKLSPLSKPADSGNLTTLYLDAYI